MRVLYIEDNQQLRESLAALMESASREVVTCESAEEALEHDASTSFDLVITDVTLPGMNGLELCRHMLAKDPSRWIVLCTGHQMDDDTKSLGPNVRALQKPFGVDELESLLDSVPAR